MALARTRPASLVAAVIIYSIMRSAQSFQKKCRAALIQLDPIESIFSALVRSLKPETLERNKLLVVSWILCCRK